MHSYKSSNIYSGGHVSGNDDIYFNFDIHHSSEDTVKLISLSSGRYDDKGVRYFYAYEYSPESSDIEKQKFKDIFEQDTSSHVREDTRDFIDNGVLEFDKFFSVSNYAYLLHTDYSRSSSLNMLVNQRFGVLKPGMLSIESIDSMYDGIKFDKQSAYELAEKTGYSRSGIGSQLDYIQLHFKKLKIDGQLFQIQNLLPLFIRPAFYDLLQFKTEQDRILFESLQGVDVFMHEEFFTSVSTVNHVRWLIHSINPMNRLTVFVLVK